MTYSAVIIDNRPSEKLDLIIADHAKYLPSDWEIIHIKDREIHNLADYNKILLSKDFWENATDKVLIFQHDSQLLREGIEEFLEYDFIGAPIIDSDAFNGGLSLRDRAMMLKVLEEVPYNNMHEDMYFSYGVRRLLGRLPDTETASKFSVETIFSMGSLGYHAIDKHLTPEQCDLIRNQYV